MKAEGRVQKAEGRRPRARAVRVLTSALCLLPSAFIFSAFISSAQAAVPPSERDALLALYDSTNGATWTSKNNWRGAAGTECHWEGIFCNENETNVTDIDLGDHNLTGTLPSAIRNLTKLRSIQIYNNAIGGPIPPEFAELSSLEVIYAASNQFSGTIPTAIAGMAKLRIFDFGGSRLGGLIPPALGNLLSLEELHLGSNQFTGEIPVELAKLTHLTTLDLANNHLAGKIPDAIGTMSSLQYLFLDINQLTGSVPASLGDLSSLLYLGLSNNQLTGTIPPQLGKLRSVEQLNLAVNQLTGTIPKELGNLENVRILIVAQNQLTGTIPDDLYRLTTLVELYVGDNQLEGTISPKIANLSKLEVLYLHDNKLTGSIPIELTTIAPLRVLLAPRNQLSGEIPRELSRLTNLELIELSSNKLRGAIPRELGTLSKLTRLSLDQNELQGTIPPELGSLSSLEILELGDNNLTGTIPDALRNLKKLQQVSIDYNDLEGQLPSWLGEWTELVTFFASGNGFTGPIPASVSNLTKIVYFSAGDNFLTGPLPDFSRLGDLYYFVAGGNQLSGPIPPSIGAAKNLNYLDLGANALSGSLPREIGQLENLENLALGSNQIEGAIPPQIGQLKKATSISLYGNRLTGTIPKEIGDLASIQYLDLSFNALRGSIPREITKLTTLFDDSSGLQYNALFSSDPDVVAFLKKKVGGGGNWQETQTITPTNVRVTNVTDRSATLQWTPIEYSYDNGGYQVVASKTAGGAPASVATTLGKDVDSIVVRNLDPLTTYFFTVATVTHPHYGQDNLIVSDPTTPVSATTTARVVAPPEVAVSETTTGLVQIGGAAANEDSFTLTNYGDGPATLSIAKDGDFFTLEADAITLAGGASRTIKVRSLSKPIGTYYGSAYVIGEGAGDGLYIPIVLLSVAKPVGTVIAEPVDTRIEIAGVAGSDAVGTARFRNRGTAALSGVVIADQPWVVPSPEPVTIDPGQTASVNFRIIRSRRPQSEGALTATLSLVYVDGSVLTAFDTTPGGGINISKVTIVDLTKPPVTAAPFGVAPQGEIALFVPGVASGLRGFGSDLSILNGSSSHAVSDLRLFFSLTGGASSVATLQPLASNQTVTLTNVVANVYSAASGSGTLQVRSAAGESLSVLAKMSGLRAGGTFSGETPVFRGDRSVAANEKIYLAGLRQTCDLIVQEVSGTATTVRIELLDVNGAAAKAAQTSSLAALGLLELRDATPANAVTAVITNVSGGRIVAYARVTDSASGDVWSIVDWSRQNRYALTDPMRVPFAQRAVASGGGGGRRRAVHTNAVTAVQTDLTLFNPAATESKAVIEVISANGRVASREIELAPLQTTTVANAVTTTDAATAHILITPLGRTAQIVVTARTKTSAVPVVGALEGLRVGQARVFAGLDDSTSATIAAASPATFTTAYGFVETAGESMRVRARLFLDNKDRSIVSASIFRDFDLPARGQIYLPELVRSFAPDRDTQFGDLHDLRLQIEILEGKGAVVPFVVVTDNGSGDGLVRTQ